jgi:multidrug resistance efflux pump
MLRCFMTLLALAIAGTSTRAEVITAPCVLRDYQEVDVPAQRDGLIGTLDVERGGDVGKDELLATLEKREAEIRLRLAQAELALATARSENLQPENLAKLSLSRAEIEQRLIDQLGADSPYLERFRSDNNRQRAVSELEAAKYERAQFALQAAVETRKLEIAQLDLEKFSIRSPVSGVVREIVRFPGEWVSRGETILTVTRLDQMLAEAVIDSKRVAPHRVAGMPVTVTLEIAGEEPIILRNLRVQNASPRVELDGRFSIWIEINNLRRPNLSGAEQWVLRPGMNGQLKLAFSESELAQ